METTPPRTSLRKWLLRIFLGSFLLAIAAPVVIAVSVLHLSGDTRALRNAAIHGDGAHWKRQIELNLGALPFWVARMVVPFTPAPPEAQQALQAIRSVEVSVHELRESRPDRARILREADDDMRQRGWDRVVGVLEHDTAVAIYARPEGGRGGNVKVSVLVVEGKQMVAVTGHAKLEPILELAMTKAHQEILAKTHHSGRMIAEARNE